MAILVADRQCHYKVDVKVQTSDDTREGVYTTKQRNENTRQPSLHGLFEVSH